MVSFLLLTTLIVLLDITYCQQTWTVGSGTPASCTEVAFTNALSTATTGDTINFDCGAVTCNDITISLSQSIWIDKSITIDGAITTGSQYRVILDGGHNHRQFILANTDTYWGIFAVDVSSATYTLTLKNLILQNGGIAVNDLRMNARLSGWGGPPDPSTYTYKGDGGCIYIANNGTAILNNVAFTGCQSIGTEVLATEPLDTRYRGGAIFVGDSANLYTDGCTFCSKFRTNKSFPIVYMVNVSAF